MKLSEPELREELRELARPVTPRVDLNAVVVRGNLLRQRRRTTWAAGGVMTVLAAGLAIQLSLSGRPMPAVPAPLATPSASVAASLEPGTPTSEPTPTSDVDPIAEFHPDASLELDLTRNHVTDDAKPAFKKVRYEAQKLGDGYRVRYTATGFDGAKTVREAIVGANEMSLVDLDPRLQVGFIPDEVTWAYGMEPPSGHGNLGYRPMKGAKTTALVVTYAVAADQVSDVFWEGSDSAVRDGTGAEQPSVWFPVKGGEIGYFHSTDGLVECLLAIDGSGPSSCSRALEADADSGRAVRIVSVGGGGTPFYWNLQAVVVLPEGAAEPKLELAGKPLALVVEPFQGGLAVLANADKLTLEPDEADLRITFRDASGQLVEVR